MGSQEQVKEAIKTISLPAVVALAVEFAPPGMPKTLAPFLVGIGCVCGLILARTKFGKKPASSVVFLFGLFLSLAAYSVFYSLTVMPRTFESGSPSVVVPLSRDSEFWRTKRELEKPDSTGSQGQTQPAEQVYKTMVKKGAEPCTVNEAIVTWSCLLVSFFFAIVFGTSFSRIATDTLDTADDLRYS